MERVIEEADEVCCFCSDGNSARPYQIHHAEDYARTQDNSEDNLILVCPTRHQSVPKHLSADEQKAVRLKWHNVVEIARAYRKRGLDFPFGLFVAMDYGLQPHPEELIDGYRLSNATALAASHHELTREGVTHLASVGCGQLSEHRGTGRPRWRSGSPAISGTKATGSSTTSHPPPAAHFPCRTC